MKNKTTKKRLSSLLCLIVLISYGFGPRVTWPAFSIFLAGALLLLFFSAERIEDERVEHLKLKAIQGGLGLSFGVALVLMWLGGRPAVGVRALPVNLPSAFDLIIVTILIALGLFYYWRWQDGRAVARKHDDK